MKQYVERLQVWRDRYELHLEIRPRVQPLDLISHWLVEFQHLKYDEVEVPGQYLEVRYTICPLASNLRLACSTRIRLSILSRSLGFLLSLSSVVEIHSASGGLHSLGMMVQRTTLQSSYRLLEVAEGKNASCKCLGSSIREVPPFFALSSSLIKSP